MAQKRKKYYVVWEGRVPGVYDDWEDVREQVENFPGARFKGYPTAADAAQAFRNGLSAEDADDLARMVTKAASHASLENPAYAPLPPGVDPNGWAVDAACARNPGVMEYRGVDLQTRRQIFHVGPFALGTNNIGEFLGIVHALALMKKRGERHTIYTDSRTAIAWVRTRHIKTNLPRNEKTEYLFQLMERAIQWLNGNAVEVPIIKWETKIWGEIPADFGRK